MSFNVRELSAISRRFHLHCTPRRVLYLRTVASRFHRTELATSHRTYLSSSIDRPSNPGLCEDEISPYGGLLRPVTKSPALKDVVSKTEATLPFPTACPGCGALSQTLAPDEAGFYSASRKAVRSFLRQQKVESPQLENEGSLDISTDATTNPHDDGASSQVSNTTTGMDVEKTTLIASEVPVCDRCHNLLYNNTGTSIAHPTIEALADSIAESPFNRNHIYHVLDAADFPMSLIPHIFKTLELAKPRSQNRRAKTKFTTKPTISFIITRSDLLGPNKEMVDKMMPYFQNLLRSALGRVGHNMRLGNVHLVSAKRGWWTKELKDDIWERGGGNWMIGKANVGKSNLFPVLFPKGSGERAPVYAELRQQHDNDRISHEPDENGNIHLPEDSLLPPAQPEVPFPTMPLVSHLPGTTASPIRLPFGNHKGELIDLPGLDRGNLEQYIAQDHKSDIVMQYRPNVKQYVIKPGQSLLLGGGLIRITPFLDVKDTSTTMLAYPFIPIQAHVTSTDKAIGTQDQTRESGISSIFADGAGVSIKSSGTYRLDTDVTKVRAAALLRAGVPISNLPFKVYSCDVLIEGVGWIELVCQVRKRRNTTRSTTPTVTGFSEYNPAPATNANTVPLSTRESNAQSASTELFNPFSEQSAPHPIAQEDDAYVAFPFPEVEIFSPNGQHIGQRSSLGAWMLWNESKRQKTNSMSARPRKSMKGVKRQQKLQKLQTLQG